MIIMTFCGHKGGNGKTTSTQNVGAALVSMGKRVLFIDTDSQANLTVALGYEKVNKKNIATLMLGQTTWEETIKKGERFDLLPASFEISFLEKLIGVQPNYEYMLRDLFKKYKKTVSYDYILIDCPPNLGPMTSTALVAANEFYVPLQPESFAQDGLITIMSTVRTIQQIPNKKLKVGGIFFTKFSDSYRKTLWKDLADTIRESYKGMVLNTSIRDNIAISEAQFHQQDVISYNPSSNGAQDYLSLTNEILSKHN